MSCLLGVVPPRFNWDGKAIEQSTYFAMARGRQTGTGAQAAESIAACEMTKWFDTNYHFLVPEVHKDQRFKLSFNKLFDELAEAKAAGFNAKAVITGPLSWLWLAKVKGEHFDKLQLVKPLIEAYKSILTRLQDEGIEWVQIDEPVLVLDLPDEWKQCFTETYQQLKTENLKILLTTYFGELEDNLDLACALPVDALHIDAVRGIGQLDEVLQKLPADKILSLGIIDGRNIWRTDLDRVSETIKKAQAQRTGRLWIAPSCSLLHVPVDLEQEQKLDSEIKSWLAFAKQKLNELKLLSQLFDAGEAKIADELRLAREAIAQRQQSGRIHHQAVKQRVKRIDEGMLNRNSVFKQRCKLQNEWLKLPPFPTTTIGSFPQTRDIRMARRDFKQGKLAKSDYVEQMQQEILHVVKEQEKLGLDVLVHGEPERNDMVEYFGELLNGFAFTEFAWVQSYGSRCVKPPIIYGDISRPQAMTIEWIRYAQSCTDKPMKGMLTGPVTLVNWSFVRDDQPRAETATQIALALRDEVHDLEQAGIKVIQIDEAALREGLPLRKKDWADYLSWTVRAFRLTAGVAADDTQIHTHMCYSEFNDIIQSIAQMDADVITIETSRSDMELLDAFENFDYPNGIGPGVYDIHSPNVPTTQDIVDLMHKATERIPVERLWVNPDCGLKTRKWPEVNEALTRMVQSAEQLRSQLAADTAQA